MKTGNIILLGVVAAGGLWAWNKYNAVKLMQVGFQGINFSTVNSGVVTLSLKNPSNQDLSINAVQGNIVDSGGNILTTVVNTVPVTIPANGSVSYPVNFYLSLTQAISTVLNSLSSGNLANLSFNGTVTFEGFTIPVNQSLPV